MYSWKARLAYDRLVRSGCSDYKIFLLVMKSHAAEHPNLDYT